VLVELEEPIWDQHLAVRVEEADVARVGALRDPEIRLDVLHRQRHAQFAVKELAEKLAVCSQVIPLAESVVQNNEFMLDTCWVLPVGAKKIPKRDYPCRFPDQVDEVNVT
jgi:hypothetical protein